MKKINFIMKKQRAIYTKNRYNTFSVTIKKECDNGKIITHKLKLIDSFRFMPTSLSERVDNMSGVFKM